VKLGREGNDINFPDDPYISGHHAEVRANDNGFELVDMGSKNGTFYRIKGPHKLLHGNYMFIGQQLLRVEITSDSM
jgi:pSer/pThr/pTyr-binding forkhead associated (FHA) protein